MKRKPTTPKVNHAVLAKTVKLFLQGQVSAYTIAAHTKVTVATAYGWLKELRKQHAIHITSWLPDTLGRERIPVFSLGKGKDVPRKKMSREEILQRYKEKQNAAKNAG